MKRLFIPALLIGVAAISSCHDAESDMAHMQELQDSISKNYPTVAAIHIKPEDRENLIVVLGDTHLYAASPASRQQEAIEIASTALKIFGKNTYLKTGKLVVTKDLHNTADDPADGISSDMHIDSLKKVMWNK